MKMASNTKPNNLGMTILAMMVRAATVASMCRTSRDEEGDITAWIHAPTYVARRANPGLNGVTAHLLND
jgi:hypothetical protein